MSHNCRSDALHGHHGQSETPRLWRSTRAVPISDSAPTRGVSLRGRTGIRSSTASVSRCTSASGIGLHRTPERQKHQRTSFADADHVGVPDDIEPLAGPRNCGAVGDRVIPDALRVLRHEFYVTDAPHQVQPSKPPDRPRGTPGPPGCSSPAKVASACDVSGLISTFEPAKPLATEPTNFQLNEDRHRPAPSSNPRPRTRPSSSPCCPTQHPLRPPTPSGRSDATNTASSAIC